MKLRVPVCQPHQDVLLGACMAERCGTRDIFLIKYSESQLGCFVCCVPPEGLSALSEMSEHLPVMQSRTHESR